MKNGHKKTLLGSIVFFIIGTSCCWMSAIAIWLGGATTLGLIIKYVESAQTLILIVASSLFFISMFLFFRKTSNR